MLSGRRAGAVFSYALMALEMASGLLFTPFLIRCLGQGEYGVYSLSLTITGYLTLLDLGVGNAMVRYFSKFRAEGDVEGQRRFAGLSLAFYSAVCLLMAALLVPLRGGMASLFGGLSESEAGLAADLLMVTVANTGVTMLASVFDKVLAAYELFALSKVVQIARVVIKICVQVALLLAGFGSMGVAVSNLALSVAAGLATAIIAARKTGLAPSFRGMDPGFVREALGYTSLVFVQMVATQINASADQVILGMIGSSAILGVYAVGAQINQYQQSIAGGINGVTMPSLVRMVVAKAGPGAIQDEMVKVGRLCFLVIGMVMGGFIAVGDDFVALWAGPGYGGAYCVAVLLMLPMTLTLIQSSGSQVLWAMGRHRTQAIIKMCVALANVALTVGLAKWNPLIGAALGSAIACLLGDVLAMNIVFRRDIGIDMGSYYAGLLRGILPSIVVASLAGFALKLLLPLGWQYLAAEVLAMLAVYCCLLCFRGLSEYERSLMTALVGRVPLIGRLVSKP